MFEDMMIGNFIAIYTIKQDMVVGKYIYKNVLRQIPCFLMSKTYVSAREEALSKRDKNITLSSVVEISEEQKKLILKVFE